MSNKNSEKYNSHAKFMAEIAVAVLNWNKNVLDVNWVKEIIALYLLIPYITPDTLVTPWEDFVLPKLEGAFSDTVSLKNLRDSICHMFVTAEEKTNDWSGHGDYLIFDDRIFHDRCIHDKLWDISKTWNISINYVHQRLLELYNEILN